MIFTIEESNLIKDEEFKKELTQTIISNIFIEQILTKIRRKICMVAYEDNIDESLLSFIECLSCQCFLTEYIYEEDLEESITILLICDKFKKTKNFYYLPVIACYKNLIGFLDDVSVVKDYPKNTKESKSFIEYHIDEPLKELELSKTIKSIGKITNTISKKVKNQYEVSPYPRWKNTYTDDYIFPIEYMINQFVCDDCKNSNKIKLPSVLIAGCGTGSNIINYRGYEVNDITAIDFSLKSLSFAKRKAIEYQMDDVNFIQLDILNLPLLQKTFDVIECTGVLHHMEDLNNGLSKLVQCLSADGYIKLGLYSNTARSIIAEAHGEIKKFKFNSDADGIKKFRREVIFGSLKHLQKLTTTVDFYSLSTCRDLCFHEHEVRLSIDDIILLLESNNLKFCGFDLPHSVRADYFEQFPDDPQLINLNNWKIFESKYPNTFLKMYQFWAKFKS